MPEQSVADALDRTTARRSVSRALSAREEALAVEFQQFVDAATAVLARTGEIDPRVSDIVQAAGLSNAAFYRHFESKDELLLAVLDNELHDLVGHVASRMARASSPIDGIERWVRAILGQLDEPSSLDRSRAFATNRGRLALRFPEIYRHCIDQLIAPLRDAIDEAVAAGQLPKRAATHGVDHTFRLCMGCVEDHVLDGTVPTRRDKDALVAYVVGGLGVNDEKPTTKRGRS